MGYPCCNDVEGQGNRLSMQGGTTSLRAPAHHQETSRIDGGPARRSATAPTLHPAQLKKGIDPVLRGENR